MTEWTAERVEALHRDVRLQGALAGSQGRAGVDFYEEWAGSHLGMVAEEGYLNWREYVDERGEPLPDRGSDGRRPRAIQV